MPPLIPCPEPGACLLYLIRHGATPHNLQKPPRLQGSGIDGPLCDLGREQAERVAGVLAARPITRIAASPMKRAMETAGAIAERHGLSVEAMPGVIEADVGDWEGRSWPEIQAGDAENYARFRSDPSTFGYPGGETIAGLLERTRGALDAVMQQSIGQQLVVVAHSAVIRTYMGSLLGIVPGAGAGVPVMNCAVNVVQWKDGRATALTVNAVDHLM
ncbi:MAG: histidine phosphatase family protein [Planctomycetota bacterium]